MLEGTKPSGIQSDFCVSWRRSPVEQMSLGEQAGSPATLWWLTGVGGEELPVQVRPGWGLGKLFFPTPVRVALRTEGFGFWGLLL